MNNNEVQSHICKRCSSEYKIFQGDIDLLDKISPLINGNKYDLQIPRLCPSCRQRRRFAWRNERRFHRIKCDKCGKSTISVYHPDINKSIYCQKCCYSDENEYMVDFDKDLGFFKNFKNLLDTDVMLNLQNSPSLENSEYNNLSGALKNCYLCCDCGEMQDSFYCGFCAHSNDMVDCYEPIDSSQCYEILGGYNISKCYYCNYTDNSFECYFCDFCDNLKYGIGCWEIVNSQHMIFNQQVSKDEFDRFKAKYFNGNYQDLQEFKLILANKKANVTYKSRNYNNEGFVIGDYVMNSKDVFAGNFIYGCDNVRYIYESGDVFDSMDIDYSFNNLHKSYDNINCMRDSNAVIAGVCNSNCNNCYYCVECVGCNNCLGCYGIKNKQYCILNKEYSQDKYYKIIFEIIKAWNHNSTGSVGYVFGEMFPMEWSPFPYNDTIANDFFPIKEIKFFDKLQATSYKLQGVSDKNGKGILNILEPDKFISDAVLDLGGKEKIKIKWRTREEEINVPEGIETIEANKLPTIQELQASSYKLQAILEKAIICEKSGRPFRIIKPELEFYLKHNIPLPRRHPDVRYEDRLTRRPMNFGVK